MYHIDLLCHYSVVCRTTTIIDSYGAFTNGKGNGGGGGGTHIMLLRIVTAGVRRYSVFGLVYNEMFTRPFFPSRHCTHGNHFNPPRDIPEQLAAYSTTALSTALSMLGTHFSAGWTEAMWNKLSFPRTDQSAPAGN